MTSLSFHHSHRMRFKRSKSGFQIIESLVAIILGSMYCIALLQICAQTMRVSTTNSNKQAADFITQTVLDALRQADYSALQAGNYQLVPYTQPGPSVHPNPVAVDLNPSDLTWIETIQTFPGTVNLDISSGPQTEGDSKIATVDITWSDSQTTAKTIKTMSVIHQRGTSFWKSTAQVKQ